MQFIQSFHHFPMDFPIIFPWISHQNLSYPGDANLGRILPELREEIRGLARDLRKVRGTNMRSDGKMMEK